ncbi:DUF2330 domain-containing protein [Galbitalea sp. SE-J8]|uniref:DUF2330 domain-containing protein n=1 Tax=Galbitalea sp. SE-J8 TaxID=3054952 RepID=UPI00259C917E|nr:DUF2330 domain-containing protein [Galbitalea sp. SE-J8]MDM4763490.1 DUF2330 domain-containing protein [Galbitalea sp. SE-J8]
MTTAWRAMTVVLAAALAAASALGGAASASASTAVLPDSGAGTRLRAAVSFADGVETLDVSFTVPAGDGRVGLVLPTPSAAESSVGDGGLFDRLEASAAPRRLVEDDWWGRRSESATTGAATSAGAVPLSEPDERTVRGTNRSKLNAWLADNDLRLSDAQRDTLGEYAERGWSFALVAFDAPAAPAALQPVRLTFETKAPVFPLGLWAGSAAAVRARFYVLGPGRTELREDTRAGRPIDAAQSVVWAGPLAGTPAARDGAYLTVTDVVIDTPADQITDDVRFDAAVADDESIPSVTVYRPIALLDIPLGWLLLVWGGVGLALGIGWISYRTRRR